MIGKAAPTASASLIANNTVFFWKKSIPYAMCDSVQKEPK
jgi:hypothetical protein